MKENINWLKQKLIEVKKLEYKKMRNELFSKIKYFMEKSKETHCPNCTINAYANLLNFFKKKELEQNK